MNKGLNLFPLGLLAFSWWLRYMGDDWFAWASMLMAVFMWLAVFGNHINNNNNKNGGNV